MTIVGFNFTKISIEKLSAVKGKVSINNNVAITDLEKTDLSFGKEEQRALRFGFEFTSKYDPKIASIDLKGEVTYVEDPKKMEELISKWKKDKEVDQNTTLEILNYVLTKCNIQALILSKDMNLPPPIQLPKIKQAQQNKAK